MANITPSSLVGEARGKLGNQIYSRNRGGAYVKAYASPVQPDTIPQLDRRADLQSAVSNWQGLSESVRNDWLLYAEELNRKNNYFGSRKRTAYNIFIERCLNLQVVGSSFPNVIDRSDFSPIFSISWDTCTSSSLVFSITSSNVPDFCIFTVFASPTLSPGVSSPKSTRFSYIGNAGVENGITSNFLSSYQSIFPAQDFTAGRKIFVKLRIIRRYTTPFPPPPLTYSGLGSGYSSAALGVIS